MQDEVEYLEGSYPEAFELRQGPVSVRVCFDEAPWSPREEDDCHLGTMVCSHRNYDLGDSGTEEILRRLQDCESDAEMHEYLKREHGATVVMPLYLYDHSGISMSAGSPFSLMDRKGHNAFDPGGWDTSTVGFIFDTAEARERLGVDPKHVETNLDGEVQEYSWYLEGRVYYFNGEGHDGDGECVGGYFGEESVELAAREELDRLYSAYQDEVKATRDWAADMGRVLPGTWITTGVAV